ncbi:MAG: GNAT family N-acetyltransferase [Candidatus Omnitrophota bacterium]|nr:MAG: GNAT family N-acetyltransferase [Candidatus Omnitrophota bacterium]
MDRNPEITITKAKPSDLPYIKEKIEKYWLDGRNISVEQFFVARNKEGKPIGFIRYFEFPTFYEPCSMGVDYYWRGKGISTMLFKYVMSIMNNDKPVYILTHIPKYFERYGFKYTSNYPPEIEKKIQTACRLDRSKLHVMSLRKNR